MKGLSVTVKNHPNGFEQAMRKFKKKVDNDGRLREYRSRQEYIKNSDVKRIEKKKSIKRKLKDDRKNEIKPLR